ncbi:MAG: RNA polymerase sigma factor [Planctomycetota bacterium]|nr:MAG: RNA polymerase sigma factor [Planctomycetota bacterium]REJ87868.1 MAG: RNA polymerase sigma factor [Planctomycetota bacterium]REK26445.1 MAG: RNA polymerase sigma factor [Planctomycetota bacterium]
MAASWSATLELSGHSDEQLAAEAAREGSDGPAFNELLARHRDRVWHLCYRLMGNEQDTNDAAQEVFVRLFLNRAKFEGRSKYSTWVHGVAVRTCLTLRRSRGRRAKRETVVETPLETSTTTSESSATSSRLDLMQMLEVLSEEDRAMLILKHAENYSYEDLAKMFDLSVSACKMRLSRARQRLKEQFPDPM